MATVIDLNKGWGIMQDVHELGEMRGVYKPGWNPNDVGGAFSEWQAIPRLEHLQLTLAQQPYFGRELRYFNEHPWWYRVEFESPANAATGMTLRFEGVDYWAKVWLNGEYLGGHEGYFEPFEFEVGRMLKTDGKNLLVVQVASPWDKEVRAGQEWNRCGAVVRNMVKGTYEHCDTFVQRDVNPVGIWRPVKLIVHGGVRSAGMPAVTAAVAEDGKKADVKIAWPVGVDGKALRGKLRVKILSGPDGKVAATNVQNLSIASGVSTVSATATVNAPKLWSTWDRGGANLYRAEMAIEAGGKDVLAESVAFGIRTVSIVRTSTETKFLLNGKLIYLRGTCYLPDCYISAMDKARYERDVASMVRAGVNAIRVHVHVEKKEFYEACDKMGVVVIQDSDVNWTVPLTEDYAKRAVKIFGAMLRLLGNHPSIICWICINEPEAREKGKMNLETPGPQLWAAARELDPTRPAIRGSFNKDDLESGDSHNYTGSLDGNQTHFLDIYGTTEKLNTEFGFDAPPAMEHVRLVPKMAERLAAVMPHIAELHDYQYWYTKYYVEHYRIQKYAPCAGYFQFMWIDLCPQSFYGMYDWWGAPKVEGIGGGLSALEESNMPVGIFMEYKDAPVVIWVVNDRLEPLGECKARWLVTAGEEEVAKGETAVKVGADCRAKVCDFKFAVDAAKKYHVYLELVDGKGQVVAKNVYEDVFHPPKHPEGHPQRMEHELGMRLYWA